MGIPEGYVDHDSAERYVELVPELAAGDRLETVVEEDEDDDEEEEPGNATLSTAERLQSADPLKLYVRQLGNGRLLTRSEERELARLKDLGDENAKRRLIESNLRLVMSITRNYTRADCST